MFNAAYQRADPLTKQLMKQLWTTNSMVEYVADEIGSLQNAMSLMNPNAAMFRDDYMNLQFQLKMWLDARDLINHFLQEEENNEA